jgi:predicted alpha/beta-hydrolase family hydrolase
VTPRVPTPPTELPATPATPATSRSTSRSTRTPAATTIEVETPLGPARVHLSKPAGARGSVVLTHGASGSIRTSDLVAVRAGLVAGGWAVALVEQAWAVAGRKMPPPAATQDPAWLPILERLASGRGRLPRPLVVGGKSNGARVAFRTAHDTGADAVLALAFPLHPPGRPQASRAGELRAPVPHGIPLHVVQGETDPFGTPAEVRAELPDPSWVTVVQGGHGFTKKADDVVAAALAFVNSLG